MKTKRRNKQDKPRKLRLWGRTAPRLPRPTGKDAKRGDFALRVLGEADGRCSVVKETRRRLKELMEDAGANSFQKRALAARAIFLLAYLESQEIEALEGNRVDMGSYVHVMNCLTGCLNKLGLSKQSKKGDAISLEDYLATDGSNRKRKQH